ncbi:MAG: hypothetical protein Q7W45_16265 [Bacteroidota bacterium]|nr:hypothetical protein [Bacteroidota bacterium]MDP3145429.1 hypothetical protein [Bacteroidota bacterium]MDP3557206.1 hypothetical protein [Bacteroidota bacterium]
MNYLKLVIIGILFFILGATKAQVSVNINVGSPPAWGPVGYTETRYYYLPDVEAYYDVQSSMFIYFGNGVWLHRTYLPTRYRHYDLYSGYKVVMVDYHGNQPYHHHKEYKIKYKKGYRGAAQKTIGSKPGKGNSKNNFESSPAKQKNNNGGNKGEQKNYKGNSHEKKGGGKSHGGGKGKK